MRLSEMVGRRLREGGVRARTIQLKLRYTDFTTITRSHSSAPTRDATALALRAVQLLERTDAGRRPVRLLGVSVHNFCTNADALPPDRLPFDSC
jgi:DNA polymerase-4